MNLISPSTPTTPDPDPTRLLGDRTRRAARGIPLDSPLIFLPLHSGPSDTGHFTLAIHILILHAQIPYLFYRILYYDSCNAEAPPYLRPHIRTLLNTPPNNPILLIPTPTQIELECLPWTIFAAIMIASFPSSTAFPWKYFLPPGNLTLNT